MTNELETLKDLETKFKQNFGKGYRDFQNNQRLMSFIKELKAEAVKRAKLYTYKANKKGLKDYEIRYWTARRIEVMEFNNLTEEDLKEVQGE